MSSVATGSAGEDGRRPAETRRFGEKLCSVQAASGGRPATAERAGTREEGGKPGGQGHGGRAEDSPGRSEETGKGREGF